MRRRLFHSAGCGFLVLIIMLAGCQKNEEPVSGDRVYMLGRSVMEGWFYHWGWDGDDSHAVVHDSFSFYHRTVDSPDAGAQQMVNSVQSIVNGITADQPVVFFKLCFADFVGTSQAEAEANLTRNEGIIEDVYEIIVADHGYQLIIGNALPVPQSWIDQFVVWNQTQYNQWLIDFQNQHAGNVSIFDMYSILVDTNGAISDEYTDGEPDDAHLNDPGYSALDSEYFDFLKDRF